MRIHSRPAFTLIEVLLAIGLAGFALLGGRLLLDQLGDSSQRVARESATASREANGERLLRHLLLNVEASADSSARFVGDEHTTSFRSWCATPSAWLERCLVTLAIDTRTDSSAVLADLSTGEHLDLHRQRGHAEWRYVDLGARDTTWFARWGRSITSPHAVALVAGADTTLYVVGAGRD